MKVFIFLLVLASLYTFGLLKTSDLAIGQVEQLNNTYQYVANNASDIAGGQPIPSSIAPNP